MIGKNVIIVGWIDCLLMTQIIQIYSAVNQLECAHLSEAVNVAPALSQLCSSFALRFLQRCESIFERLCNMINNNGRDNNSGDNNGFALNASQFDDIFVVKDNWFASFFHFFSSRFVSPSLQLHRQFPFCELMKWYKLSRFAASVATTWQ